MRLQECKGQRGEADRKCGESEQERKGRKVMSGWVQCNQQLNYFERTFDPQSQAEE